MNRVLIIFSREKTEVKDISSKQIFQDGLNKADPICAKVLEFYAKLLGKEASNFALDSLPYAGIYLVGGMINSVKKYFSDDEGCPFIVTRRLETVLIILLRKHTSPRMRSQTKWLNRFSQSSSSTYEELGLLGTFVSLTV